jgi:malonyl-CoA O-methyltransferase
VDNKPLIHFQARARQWRRAQQILAKDRQALSLFTEFDTRLWERLSAVQMVPEKVAQLSAPLPANWDKVAARYPKAEQLNLWPEFLPTTAQPALRGAHHLWQRLQGRKSSTQRIDLDAGTWPANNIDLFLAPFGLQSVADLPTALAAAQKSMRVGGCLALCLLGVDSLRELSGEYTVHRFIDMHDIGDMLIEAGLSDPVLDVERLTLRYSSFAALVAELGALGARQHQQAPQQPYRPQFEFRRFCAAPKHEVPVEVSLEVIYAHAWKPEPKITAEGHAIVTFRPYKNKSNPTIKTSI